MDSDLLSDIYEYIPEKFFLKKQAPRFDIYRYSTERILGVYELFYISKNNTSIFNLPSYLKIYYSTEPDESLDVAIKWCKDGKYYRKDGPERIYEFTRPPNYCSVVKMNSKDTGSYVEGPCYPKYTKWIFSEEIKSLIEKEIL